MSIWPRRMSAPGLMMPASAGTGAEPSRPPAPGALLGQYQAWLARRGRGNRCFTDGAIKFLQAWPVPQAFTAQTVEEMLAADQHTRPFITFLLLHDELRPGYDYLVARKFAALVELADGTRLQAGLHGFLQAADELGFSPHVQTRAAERVIARLLIQTGRGLHQLTIDDLRELETAFQQRAQARGKNSSNDRGFPHAAWTVLFHLGVVEVAAPNRRRHDHAVHSHHFCGVPSWLAGRLPDYATSLTGHHADSTMDRIPIPLAHLGPS